MYDPYTDNWKREVGMATAGVLRALARSMPTIVAFYALCYFFGLMLSAPYEITCKSTTKPKAVRLLAPKAPAPVMQEPVIKAKDE